MRVLLLLMIVISFTNCVTTKKHTEFRTIKEGVKYVLDDIYNYKKKDIKRIIIFDSISYTKFNYSDSFNTQEIDTKMKKIFQKALSEVLEENNEFEHSTNKTKCNIILQNPKSNLCFSG